jgi:hypothetical protein
LRNKLLITAVIIISAFGITSGCVKQKGDFAFKKFTDDKYRTVDGVPEFEKNEKINWVYAFKEIRSGQNIIVTIFKKELVWVDISSRLENISPANKIIYGTIADLSDGTYKIVLSSENKVISEREFEIFTEHEDYYQYKDE